MTLPALRALVTVLPAPIVLFAMPTFRHILLADIVAARDVPIRLSMVDGRNRFEFEIPEPFPAALDLLISLNPWHSADVDRLVERLRPAKSIGMSKEFDVCVRSTRLEHSIDRAFRVARAIDPSLLISDFIEPPSLSRRAIADAWNILDHVPHAGRVMTVHNDTLPHKVWSQQRLAEVMEAFLSAHTDVTAISLDRENRPVPPKTFHHRFLRPEHLSLEVALALVSRSNLFLGVDSCMLHMADICRVAGVGLFGPNESTALGSAEMGFRFGPHRHVHGNGSMDGIHTKAVLTALEEVASYETK